MPSHLPVRQRVLYKMAVLTARKTRTTGVMAYLNEHLVPHVAVHHTRSASLPLLTVPKLTTDFSRRSFSYSAPVICAPSYLSSYFTRVADVPSRHRLRSASTMVNTMVSTSRLTTPFIRRSTVGKRSFPVVGADL